MATTPRDYITKTYLAAFLRAPELSGLNYWTTELVTNQKSMTEVGGIIFSLPTVQAIYPSALTDKQFVEAIYHNVFGRVGDEAGIDYWVKELVANRDASNSANAFFEARGQLVFTMIEAGLGTPDGTDGKLYIENRLDVANEAVDLQIAAQKDIDPEDLVQVMTTVTADPATVASATTQLEALLAVVDAFTLTNGTDIATSNVFEAPLVYTPGGDDRINSLQDEDVLTGTGENPTLNATLGNANDNGSNTITPEMNGIEVVNVAFTGSGGTAVNELDLQDAIGISDAINITRISDGTFFANIDNIRMVPATMSLSNSGQIDQNVNFAFRDSALQGSADIANMEISDVQIGFLGIQTHTVQPGVGFETVNLTSTGASNSIGVVGIEDAETVNITGDEDLALGGQQALLSGFGGIVEGTVLQAAFQNVAGSLSKIDASGLDADLSIALGAETVASKDDTPGTQVNFNLIGSKGVDDIVLVGGMNKGDVLDLGEGENTLTVLATTIAGQGLNTQTLNILNQTNVPNTIGVDAGLIGGLKAVVVRNEGQAGNIAAASDATFNVIKLGADAASDVTLRHGTTFNNDIDLNTLQLDGADGVTAMTVKIADAVNTQTRFNFELYTDSDLTLGGTGAVSTGKNDAVGVNAITSLTLADLDSESNTVALSAQGYDKGSLLADAGTSYTAVSVTNGKAGQFLNLDSTELLANASGAFGVNNTGVNGNFMGSTPSSSRDGVYAATYTGTTYADSSAGVGNVMLGFGTGAAVRLIAPTIDASSYAGDFIARVGKADQTISTGSGNDTVIFDAIDDTRAGLTISDKVAMGTGIDTLVLDGGMTIAPANIVIGASEWTNLTGVDVLRLGTNDLGGKYQLTVTDQLIDQTDVGNRITIINNDGDLRADNQSEAVIDMRQSNGMSATNFVNFFGENGSSAAGNAIALASNRVILSDATANGGHILNGGDVDLQAFADPAAWAASLQGNNNSIEYRNSAVVTAGDQAGISNFNRIVFNNDQATKQTLTLELTTAVVDALADASHVAAADAQEFVVVQANDGSVVAPLAGAALNIDARQLSNAFRVVAFTDNNNGSQNLDVADVINVRDNIGGAAGHIINMIDHLDGTAGAQNDVLTFFGAAGDQWSTLQTDVFVSGEDNFGTLTIQNASGLATVQHTVQWENHDTVRLTDDDGVSFTDLHAGTSNLRFLGGAGNDVIIGTAGNNEIDGNVGADQMTGGLGNDTFTYSSLANVQSETGITLVTADSILDFDSANDAIKITGTAGTAANYSEAAAVANFAAAQAAADTAMDGTVLFHLTSTAADGGLLFVDSNADGTADAVIQLTGINSTNFALGDIIA